jgi:nicotinamidase-related amidase
MSPDLHLHPRRQMQAHNERGWAIWQPVIAEKTIPAAKAAIIVCDMWDRHWCRGAAERVDAMAPRMNQVLGAARAQGVQIIHAPSNTIAFYVQTPARRRILAAPPVQPPPDLEHADPPLPVDASDHGSDTGETETARVWTRQHPAIAIDQDRDAISDDGREIYSFMQQQGIRQVLLMGVHTNMCILNRSFAIKQMVRWGLDIALVRDLTDAMYNPARPPYVSHDEGTALVIGYIEKFWCPTIVSADLA